MKRLGIAVLLGISLLLIGCGSDLNGGLNGNWNAALVSSGSGSAPVFSFSVFITEMGGGSISITNLNFTTANPCFVGGSTATGGFMLSGNMNGVTSGGFQMNIQSAPGVGNNLLMLQGTVNNNTITGTWTLAGTTADCTGSGSFTMRRF